MHGHEHPQPARQHERVAAVLPDGDGTLSETLGGGRARATTTLGFSTSISVRSHRRQTLISPAVGRLCSLSFPRGSNLKCLTALVT